MARVMTEGVRLDLRRQGEPRQCAYCHDEIVVTEFVACATCGAACHASCRAELRRCPTLGCGTTTLERVVPRALLGTRRLVGVLCIAWSVVVAVMLYLDPPHGRSAAFLRWSMPVFAAVFAGLGLFMLVDGARGRRARRRGTPHGSVRGDGLATAKPYQDKP
jgi:hypothetical protein